MEQLNMTTENKNEPEEQQMSEEAMEDYRIYLRKLCCKWLFDFILHKSLIKLSANLEHTTIFKFSAPAKIGYKTPYYSQICINGLDPNNISLVYGRPKNHTLNDWYFPIYYILNGKSFNKKRNFENIGIIPVIQSLQNAYPDKFIKIQYRKGVEYDYNIINVSNIKTITPHTTTSTTTTPPTIPDYMVDNYYDCVIGSI